MRKLLSANFARLWKSKAFWVVESGVLAFGLLLYGLLVYNTKNLGELWLRSNAHMYFFYQMLYIGAAIAIFTSQFFGTEYDNGTIRNKLSVGHCRHDIYLSSFLVTASAGIIFVMTHALLSVIAVPFVGIDVWTAINAPVWRIFCMLIICMTYAAIFTLIAMLDSSKSRSAIISLLLALVLIAVGMYIYNGLAQPEFASRMVMQEDGSYLREDNIPNPNYISGTTRTVYEWLSLFLPTSQGLNIAISDGVFDWKMPLCNLLLIVCLCLIGIAFLKKKDIK